MVSEDFRSRRFEVQALFFRNESILMQTRHFWNQSLKIFRVYKEQDKTYIKLFNVQSKIRLLVMARS